MMIVEHCLIAGFLLINSWTDIRRRKVSLLSVGIFLAAGIVWSCFCERTERILLGLLPGAALILISRATREALGMGDALLVLVLGVYLGFRDTVNVLLLALFLAAFWAGILLAVKRKKKDYEFPFVPFLLAGYVGRWLLCAL